MSSDFPALISKTTGIAASQVISTLSLIDGGATIPFMARYRKEVTGSLDEVALTEISDAYTRFRELAKRKETILSTISDQGQLTAELKKTIIACWDAVLLEDLYLPYKPKRKTRASMAKEKGLEPLAAYIYRQRNQNVDAVARKYVNRQVANVEEGLQGARDIIAEWISEDARIRESLRLSFTKGAAISSSVVKKKKAVAVKYKDYFDFSEPLKKCPSHRMLAMRRGEAEGLLKVTVAPDQEWAFPFLERRVCKGQGEATAQVRMALKDAYKRLLLPSLETEFKNSSKAKADQEAIKVFAENLRQLLLAPPLGEKRVMGIDPGFRTGCKVVCLSEQGTLLHNDTIYPHPPQNKNSEAAHLIQTLLSQYKGTAIAIGNGTAGRETERFIKGLPLGSDIEVFMVNEAGASIYSASAVAREEFPDKDITVRGAVSIGRRLMDPLSELVKIDAKSIGVGQYQHDVNQKALKASLDLTVTSAVNAVGINLNTASQHLLTYVSGLGPTLAKAIVHKRTQEGPFTSRQSLKEVPRLGAKAYEQCAGFLRIKDADNPLDNTAVHPESYPVVRNMAKNSGVTISELISSPALIQKIELQDYLSDKVGLPTLTDIKEELLKPGLDPRGKAKTFEFGNVHKIEDVREGMRLPGLVTNLTKFGAFVDVGVKQDGMVHISQIADKYISDPAEILRLGQEVWVKVMEVDINRKRINLSIKEA